MKKTITIIIFLLILSLTIVISRGIHNDNISPLKQSYLPQSTVRIPVEDTYTLTPTISAVKTLTPAKELNQAIPSPTPFHTSTSTNTGLTVFKKNEKTIDIYFSMTDGKSSFIRFEKKSNGTWNLRGWYLSRDKQIPSQKATLLAGSTSDWEYVLRVANKANGSYQFSGGSHGNEILQSFKLFDTEKSTDFSLNIGQKVHVSKLKIIEDTHLTMSGSKKYASVRRTYIISPSKIDLYTDYNFISDVYVGTSYVCMIPITKTYGRNIKFIDTNNVYKTPESGRTLSTNEFSNYIGKEKTLSVEMWGDHNPSYRCIVGIENEEMADKFQNELKVFYWDINTTTNKLYFSKYDNEDYTQISKGTKWSNHAFWEYQIKK